MVVALFGSSLLMTACTDEPEPEPTHPAAEPFSGDARPYSGNTPTANDAHRRFWRAYGPLEPTQAPHSGDADTRPCSARCPSPNAIDPRREGHRPTPVPPPPATPTPAPVEVEAATSPSSAVTSSTFPLKYPEGWELSEEDRRITVTVPGKSVEVAVNIHILTTPQSG